MSGLCANNFRQLQQLLKNWPELRLGIVNPNNLQAIDDNLFVVENGDADIGQRRKEWRTIGELFVITRYKIGSGGRTEAGPRFNCFRNVDRGTIEHITGNKDCGRLELVQLLDNFANESRSEYIRSE